MDEVLVEEELVPVFEDMVQDTEVVQIGIIKHIAAFLSALPDLCRVSYLPILHEILHSTNPFNWRLRQYLAVQLPDLVALPAKHDVFRTLYPTIMTLLQDPVASVRCDTFQGVTALINALRAVLADGAYDKQVKDICSANLDEVINSINAFITSDKFQMRQLWMELAPQLLRDLPREFFEQHFLKGVFVLTLDKVFNVRLAVSNFLVGWYPDHISPWDHTYRNDHSHDALNTIMGTTASRRSSVDHAVESPWKWLLSRSDIKTCVERLSKDDRDIFANVSLLKGLYPDLSFSSVSCRGRKIPPGGNATISIDSTPISTVNETAFNGLEETAQVLEAVNERLRSGSTSGILLRGGLEHEESMNLTHMPKLLCAVEEDDDGTSAPQPSPNRDVLCDSYETEREYAVHMMDPHVADELDIIDGLKAPPTAARHNSWTEESATERAERKEAQEDAEDARIEEQNGQREEHAASSTNEE